MDGIDPNIPRFTVRVRFAPFTDGAGPGFGFTKITPVFLIGVRLSEVVQVPDRDVCKALIVRLVKDLPGAFQTAFGSPDPTGCRGLRLFGIIVQYPGRCIWC